MFVEVRCAGCARVGWSPCPRCAAELVRAPSVTVDGGPTVRAVFDHVGVGRDIVHALKFRADRAIARWAAARLAELTADLDVAAITWVPTTRHRRRSRGYDQCALLARHLARLRSCRAVGLLARVDGTSQRGRSRAERLTGPGFALRSMRHRGPLLVVDDVVTTGATAAVVARALAPVSDTVHIAVLARVPEPLSVARGEPGAA